MKLIEYTKSTWREIAETWRDNIENKAHDLISEDGWKPIGTSVLGAALLEGYDEVARLESHIAELLDVVRDCVNFLADLDPKSDRTKALHKRAYTAHSKAKEK